MSKFWRLSYVVALLLWGCTSPSYPGVDNPPIGNDPDRASIIAYIDQRLENEYYWLDEVVEKSNTFNRNLKWEDYLDAALNKLESNADDGYLNNRGERVYYSYIKEVASTTRTQTMGYGLSLYYTIVLIDNNTHYGFVVENVYANSPAEAAGIKRGDIIVKVNGNYIDQNNYYNLFTGIQGNSATSPRLELRRQTDGESFITTLEKGAYITSPITHYSIIEVDNQKIGYLVYKGFESSYDEELLAVLQEFATAEVDNVILDLRHNGGGSVDSAVKLCSALMPATMEGSTLCCIRRNPKNKVAEGQTLFALQNTGAILSLESLNVICSSYTASASELVIMGLRGLDVTVKAIGGVTQGKNCGMDVTRKRIGNTTVEYAPITFMCFNAKGFGDWGEGITPDIDLTNEANTMGVSDKNFPLPRCDWGDANHDIALAATIADITGKKISQSATRAMLHSTSLTPAVSIAKPIEGIRIYHEAIDF